MSSELLLEETVTLNENRDNRFHRLFQTGFGHGINIFPYLDRAEKRVICATSFDMHNCVHRDKLGKLLSNYYRFSIEYSYPYLEHKMYLVECEGKMYKMMAQKNESKWEFIGNVWTEKMYIYIHKKRVKEVEEIDLDVDTVDFFDEEQNFMDIFDRNSHKCSNCLFASCIFGIGINLCIFSNFF